MGELCAWIGDGVSYCGKALRNQKTSLDARIGTGGLRWIRGGYSHDIKTHLLPICCCIERFIQFCLLKLLSSEYC